ncbi:MAG: hypothetical protein ACUVSQ_11835 [Pseudanabaenaceae cyanobacterium]
MTDSEFQAAFLQQLAHLNARLDSFEQRFVQIDERFAQIDERFAQIEVRLQHIEDNSEKFNDRFANYQQATQWVIQLAFTLIASATVTVIVTSVLRR